MAVYLIYQCRILLSTEKGPDRRTFDIYFGMNRCLYDKSLIVFVTPGFAEIVYSLMGSWGHEMG